MILDTTSVQGTPVHCMPIAQRVHGQISETFVFQVQAQDVTVDGGTGIQVAAVTWAARAS
jgi:hypothetical protein